MLTAKPQPGITAVLRPLIRVNDDLALRFAPPHGHQDCIDNKVFRQCRQQTRIDFRTNSIDYLRIDLLQCCATLFRLSLAALKKKSLCSIDNSHMEDRQSKRMKTVRCAVFGFYGNENLGDEAIIEAVIANIRDSIPDAELRCISVQPVDSEERHKVHADCIFLPSATYQSQRDRIAAQQSTATSNASPSEASGWFNLLYNRLRSLPLMRPAVSVARHILQLPSIIWRHLRFGRHVRDVIGRIDVLLISGSNQFLDNFGGPSAFPYTLWLWTLIAKRNKVPIIVMSVGAGPIFSKLSMWLIHRAIRRADYLSLRDIGSVELLGLDLAATNVCPDLAYSHNSETVRTALSRDFSLSGPPVIAINPMAVHARGYWYEVNDEKYNAYVRKLSKLVQHLEGAENDFIFIANQPRDELVIRDVISAAVDSGSSRVALESRFLKSTTVEEYLQNASKADIIIATRFHGTVLALLLARPVIGLCYYKKSAELLRDFRLGNHAFDIDDFCTEDIVNSIHALTSEYEMSARNIAKHVVEYREQLRCQYRNVIKTVLTQIDNRRF